MISIFNEKTIEVLFSACFSMFIIMQLQNLISSFTNDLVFVIMFLVIAIYVYRVVSDNN